MRFQKKEMEKEMNVLKEENAKLVKSQSEASSMQKKHEDEIKLLK